MVKSPSSILTIAIKNGKTTSLSVEEYRDISDIHKTNAIMEITPNIVPFIHLLNLLILYRYTILFIISSIPAKHGIKNY
jgi:hypothetical protein